MPPFPETHWPAPAKLNLFLHVLGRRPDGYHELQTAFQLIDLADSVSIALRGDGVIEVPEPIRGIVPGTDLTERAARLLQARTRTTAGATLRLRKRIPLGGGLGGGSSDAATVLLALNALWRCGLSIQELAELGLELGADVPVFVHGASAWGEGRGERLTPLDLPERWFVIIHPGVAVSTAEVFQAPELTRNSPVITMRAFLAGEGRNDCEPVVRSRYPEVKDALEWLGRFVSARLTGTGSCIFGICSSAAEAERIAGRVPERWSSYVACSLSRSPVHERLAALDAPPGSRRDTGV